MPGVAHHVFTCLMLYFELIKACFTEKCLRGQGADVSCMTTRDIPKQGDIIINNIEKIINRVVAFRTEHIRGLLTSNCIQTNHAWWCTQRPNSHPHMPQVIHFRRAKNSNGSAQSE